MADRGNQTGEFYRKSGALGAGPLKRRDNAEVDRSCNNSWHSPDISDRYIRAVKFGACRVGQRSNLGGETWERFGHLMASEWYPRHNNPRRNNNRRHKRSEIPTSRP